MFDRFRRRRRRLSGRDLQVLFAATIVLPGVLLATIGMRAWLQDRRLAQQQLRERVEAAADLALRVLEQDVREWQALLAHVSPARPPAMGVVPARLQAPFLEPGAGAIVWEGIDAPEVWPREQVPYTPSAARPLTDEALPPLLEAGEAAEIRDQNYSRAAHIYRRAAAVLPAADAPAALHRLARTLRKAGRASEALDIYHGLRSSRGSFGALPADLVARHELAVLLARARPPSHVDVAVDLYRDLVGGRWALERTRYAFYSASVRAMLANSGQTQDEVARLDAIERRKLALAAQAFAGDELAGGRPPASEEFAVVSSPTYSARLLLSRAWLATAWWPQTFDSARRAGFDVSLLGPADDVWFATRTRPAAADVTQVVTRQPSLAGVPWRVRVSARDEASVIADLTRWRTFTLVMLLLVVALLGFGTYLTTRVVRREIEVARLQSEFVSAVSHEFRSPLTGIRQLGEMLQRGRVPDEHRRQEYYERITRESDRLSRLVENLLHAAQIDERHERQRHAPIDTSAWLRGVIEEARGQPAYRDATIHASIPDVLPPVVGDRAALTSAVHNLIDNAVKYSPGVRVVWCDAETDGQALTIRVRDQGVGMDDEDRRHAFERFRRGRGAITAEVKGTGLGLSLVADIVRAHGGQVACESRLGEGTVVSMHLAVANRDAEG